MTQYLLSVHGTTEQQDLSEEDVQRMYRDVDAFNTTVKEAGAWVFAGGLEPVGTAKVVDGRGTSPKLKDGPFIETKEHLGGFWIIEAESDEAAHEWAAKGSAACQAPVEVRPFQSE